MPRLAERPKPGADTPLEGLGVFTGDGAEQAANNAELESAGVAEPAEPVDKPKRQRATRAASTPADDFGFQSLDDTDEHLNILYWGREGSAKTTNMAHMANLAPEGSRVLVLRAEGGVKRVALQRRGVDTSKIVVWPPPGERVTFAKLEALHEKLLADLMARPGCWYGVGIDSLTEIVQTLREHATDKRITKLKRTMVDQDEVDEDFVDRDDYGVMTNQLRKWVRRMRDLPCHVVFTALEKVDDKTGSAGPSITPALAGDVLGYVDVTLATRATQHAPGEDEDADEALSEFRALTRPGKSTRAKDRFDLLPRVLADARFDRVFGYINGDLTEDADPVQAAYNERRAAEAAAKAKAEADKAERKEAARTGRSARASKAATDNEKEN